MIFYKLIPFREKIIAYSGTPFPIARFSYIEISLQKEEISFRFEDLTISE